MSAVRANDRKPVKSGLGYLVDGNGNRKRMTHKQAERYAGQKARQSSLANVAGCVGVVSDQGEYYRVSIAAMPFDPLMPVQVTE